MFCQHCGVKNSDFAKFCRSCGEKCTVEETTVEVDTQKEEISVKSLVQRYDKSTPKQDGSSECKEQEKKTDVKSIIQKLDGPRREFGRGMNSKPDQMKEVPAALRTAEEKRPEVELRKKNVHSDDSAAGGVSYEPSRRAGSIIRKFNEGVGAVKQIVQKTIFPEEFTDCPEDKLFQSMAGREDNIATGEDSHGNLHFEQSTKDCPEDKKFQSMAGRQDLRILLVGHTGHGKSSTGNSLLGRKEFRHGLFHGSITKTSHRGVVHRFGRKIDVIDTPGLYDTSHDDTFVKLELMKCVGLTLPGFNAIFLILKPERITDEIEATVDLFFDLLGEGVSDYAFIVFTHIKDDQMKKEYFGPSGDATNPSEVDELLNRFKGKALFIDNEADVSTKAGMVWKILNEIDENTAKLKVPYFTNEITEEMEKIAIDALKTQSPGLTNVDDIKTYDKKGDTSKESSQQNNKTLVPETLDKYGEGSTEENKSEGDSSKQQNKAAVLKTSDMQGDTSQQQNKTEEPKISEKYDNCSEEQDEPDVEELFVIEKNDMQGDTSQQQNKTEQPKISDNCSKEQIEQDVKECFALYKRLVSKEQNDMQGDTFQQQNKTEQPKISQKYDNGSEEQNEPKVKKYEHFKRLLEDKELSGSALASLIDTVCPKIPIIGKVCRYFLKKVLLKGKTRKKKEKILKIKEA